MISELLEPLQKQRALHDLHDYADVRPPVQEPLLNNVWKDLSDKVTSKIEMINYQFSGDYAPFHLGGLHGSRREQKGHKSNVEGLSCVSQNIPLKILNISNFKIQIGKSIKCTVDPESKKATVRVPDQYKRGRALMA